MDFYAILNPNDSSDIRNIFITDLGDDRLDLRVLDHTDRSWVDHPDLIAYLGDGPRAGQCRRIDEDEARRLLAEWGAPFPQRAD